MKICVYTWFRKHTTFNVFGDLQGECLPGARTLGFPFLATVCLSVLTRLSFSGWLMPTWPPLEFLSPGPFMPWETSCPGCYGKNQYWPWQYVYKCLKISLKKEISFKYNIKIFNFTGALERFTWIVFWNVACCGVMLRCSTSLQEHMLWMLCPRNTKIAECYESEILLHKSVCLRFPGWTFQLASVAHETSWSLCLTTVSVPPSWRLEEHSSSSPS